MKSAIKTTIILLGLSGLMACNMPTLPVGDQIKKETSQNETVDKVDGSFKAETITLKYNEPQIISSENLSLTYTELVQDSRCPINAKCIRAGDVTVKVEVKKDTTSLGSEELTFKPDSSERSDMAKIGDYSLQLTKVMPETTTGIKLNPMDYTVEIKISKS